MALPDERFEICWLLDDDARARILPSLRMRLPPCPLGGQQHVQSLYFGPPPADQAEPRRRLRIRVHESEGRPARCVVEVKHRVGLRSVVHQAQVSITDALALAAGAAIPPPATGRHVFEEARDLVATRGLHPSVLVSHERLAFVGGPDEPDLRVTVDTEITWRTPDGALAPGDRRAEGDVLAPGACLLVVKVAHAVPNWLTLLLGRTAAASRSPGKHALAAQAMAAAREAEEERASLA